MGTFLNVFVYLCRVKAEKSFCRTSKNIIMRKLSLFFLLCLSLFSLQALRAQVRYGYLHYDSLLVSMPEYIQAVDGLMGLKVQYEAEAEYNEMSFKRLFAEFLQGQKDFPQNIMLKRQRDLQDAMERSIAYRHEADSLLRVAEAEVMRPVREKLDEAILRVGRARGYIFIVNLDNGSIPFLNDDVCEDATPYVQEQLQ